MRKILVFISVIVFTMIVYGAEEPAIIASTNGVEFQYARLTSDAVILIDDLGGIPIFKVNGNEAKGTCIKFGYHDFSEITEAIVAENTPKEIEKIEIFSAGTGQKLSEPQTGVNVIVTTFTDKSTVTEKILKR